MVKDKELKRLLNIVIDDIGDVLETETDGLLNVVLEKAKDKLEIEVG